MQEIAGARLREARVAKSLTQEQVGQQVEAYLGRTWSRQAVSAAEQGRREFTAVGLVALAEILDQAPAWFFVPFPAVRTITMPGGQAIDAQRLIRHATARGAPALTAFVLDRTATAIHRHLDEMEDTVAAIEGLRDSLSTEEEQP